MHAQPRRELQRLLRHFGPGLIADPQRTEALLSDLCGEHQREIFVLVHAQRAHIPAELSRMVGQRAESAVRQRLTQQLQDRYAFSAEAAAWAVDAWADALNIRGLPVYRSWLLALWHRLAGGVAALVRARPSQSAPAYRAATHRAISPPSTFRWIGVQWNRQFVRPLLSILLLAVIIASGGIAWQQSWLEAAASWLVGTESQAVEDSWQPPSPASAATALALRFPPPLEVRIEADLLNVRAAPNLDAEVLGKVGPVGANVTVERFDPEGSWSYISAPVAGWISNEYVTFTGLYLRPGLGQVIQAGTALRREPRTDAPATATLVAGQMIVFVALSPDGQWRQVVEPSSGWVESRLIAIMER